MTDNLPPLQRERDAFEAFTLDYHEQIPIWTGVRYQEDVWEDLWLSFLAGRSSIDAALAARGAVPAGWVLDIEDLKDRLVAISSAVADGDDREAQAIIRTALQLLAAAPAAPEQQEPRGGNICTDCANSDYWGVPDKLICQECNRNSQWQPLNKSSKNPIAQAPNAQQADNWQQYATEREATAQEVIERHRGEQNSLMNLLAQARAQQAEAQPKAVPLTDAQIDEAAKVLSHCMDYPWDHMPEAGRENMRKNAKMVIESAISAPAKKGCE